MELFSEYMKVFLQIANIVIILYGGYKFLGKPHSTLEQRVSQIEKDIQDIKVCLKRGNCKFQDHDEGIEVIVLATIALIEFEIQYCTSEHKEVSKALDMSKERLHAFLAKRKGLDE